MHENDVMLGERSQTEKYGGGSRDVKLSKMQTDARRQEAGSWPSGMPRADRGHGGAGVVPASWRLLPASSPCHPAVSLYPNLLFL